MAEIISDKAVEKATGRNWESWHSTLTKLIPSKIPHKDIVTIIREKGVAHWWAQSIAGHYERAMGWRKDHEMPDGFQATASKTINVPAKTAFASFEEGAATWLPGGTIDVTTSKTPTTLRGAWLGPQGGRVDVYVSEKTTDKVTVTINHTKLSDTQTCEALKAAWRTALSALKEQLES